MEGAYLDSDELLGAPGTVQGMYPVTDVVVLSHINSVLQTYGAQEGPYQEKAKEIYKELRRNVVDNVVKVRTREIWSRDMWKLNTDA